MEQAKINHQVSVTFSTRDIHSTQKLTEIINVSEKTDAKILECLKPRHPGMTVTIIEREWLS